jgi:calcineurin-like phosphoesterase family protein
LSETFFAADHHFGHGNIIKFCDRPFSSVEEMDERMIDEWNAVVGRTDRVFYLGDLSFHKKDKTLELLYALNGIIFYIMGNHDEKRFNEDIKGRFQWVKHYHELKHDSRKIVLCHYPFETWNKAHHGSWHLHGHSHGSLRTKRGGRLDVGVDTHEFRPWSMDEVVEHLSEQKYDPMDHHGA